jgi:oligopeptide transport system substrate-binding protein
MAIDRSIITEKVLKTGEIPAVSFVPPGMPNYPEVKAPYADMDMNARRAEAKALMEAAGYTASSPFQLVLRYNTSENHKRVAIAVAKMWEAINVKTELHNADVAVHYNDIEQGDFQVARAGWIADYIDAQNFLFLLQTSSGPLNYGSYSDGKFDALMEEAAKTTDLVARGKLMAQAEQIALDATATIPIYYYVSKELVSTKVKGYEDNIANIHRSRWMTVNR